MPPPDRPHAGARRIADVPLRSPAPRRARVHWPAPCAGPAVAALVVLFSSGVDLADDLVDAVVARVDAVVLTVSAAHAVEAHAAASWAADHAAELGADAAGSRWSATVPARRWPSGSPSSPSTRAGRRCGTWP